MNTTIEYIKEILEEDNLFHLEDTLEKISSKRLNESPFKKAALEVFEDLDGIGIDLPLIDYQFDIELIDKGIIFDDDINFNRYRTKTFRSSIYDLIPSFPLQNYRRFCQKYETQCLKSAAFGSQWTTNYSEKYFGKSNVAGDLGLNGSSQWKVRAYTDFIIDLSTLIFDYNVIRISMYDTLMIKGQITMLKDILKSRNEDNKKYIISFIRKKISVFNEPKMDINDIFKNNLD